MKNNKKKNYLIYIIMLCLFTGMIYMSLRVGNDNLDHQMVSPSDNVSEVGSFEMFRNIVVDNMASPFAVLLFQIIVILITVRLFSFLFKYIGQPGVIGEIVAGIVLGPSLLGYFFPEFFHTLFNPDSLSNLNIVSQLGLVLFMFIIGMELDFNQLKDKMNETLVISHAGIVIPFFLGILASFWVYEEYVAAHAHFLPFALFIGISMSITAFPVLARIVQERNMTKKPYGILSIAAAANDDVTAWCLLAVVIAIAKAGTFVSALYTIALTLVYVVVMFGVIRPFLKKVGAVYANSEVINKTFVAFIFIILVTSAVATEIIGIHALFGAFIAGVIMPSNIGFRKVMMEKVEDVALVFFLPLFFAFTGLRTEFSLLNSPQLWLLCLLFVVVAILGKLGGCSIAARMVGESWKDSFIIGTLMNTRGLMELVALNIGYDMGILPPPIFVMLVIMTLITTFMTTPLLMFFERIFKIKTAIVDLKHKILISFGRPESGRLFLYFAKLLYGKRIDQSDIIAAHFTSGTDLNPVKAEQYSHDSFIYIEEAAKEFNLNVQERYKVTDKLVYDLIHLANEEKVDTLFVGAGQQFMMENSVDKHRNYLVSRVVNILKRSTYSLPGNLYQEKLDIILEQVKSQICIFVNRGFKDASNIVAVINDEKDLFLLSIISTIIKESKSIVRISGITKPPLNNFVLQPLAELMSEYPDRLFFEVSLNEAVLPQDRDDIILLSYDSCLELSSNGPLFTNLPSLLIIRPSLIDNSSTKVLN